MTKQEFKALTKRQALLDVMIFETKVAKKYTESAMKKIEEKKLGSAWRLADAAKCHAICAMQEHDLFWDLVGEDITSEEFDAFCEAETCFLALRKLQMELDTVV